MVKKDGQGRGKTQKCHMLCDPGSFQMQFQYECINYFSQLTVTLHTVHALFSPNAPLRSTVKRHWIANWHQWGREVTLVILQKDDKILLSVPFASPVGGSWIQSFWWIRFVRPYKILSNILPAPCTLCTPVFWYTARLCNSVARQ